MSLNPSFLNFTPNCCSREILRERRKEKAIGGVIILSQMRRVNNLRLLIKTFALHRRHSPTQYGGTHSLSLTYDLLFSPLFRPSSFAALLLKSYTRVEKLEGRKRERERKSAKTTLTGLLKYRSVETRLAAGQSSK